MDPTGLVKIDGPAKIEFLAAEALRGCGRLVHDANGKRFANKLDRHACVTGKMSSATDLEWVQAHPIALVKPDGPDARVKLLQFSVTDGEHCTGDGTNIGAAVGARVNDLESIVVHPTGLVKPDGPYAKIKFLAA